MTITMDERLVRLQRANEIRAYRAEWKQRLRAGEVSLVDTFANRELDRMKLTDVLMSMPWVGKVRTTRTLRQMRLSATTTLGELTYRQRVVLQRRFR